MVTVLCFAGGENKGHGKRAGGKAYFSLLGQMRHGQRREQLQQERDLVPVQLRKTIRWSEDDDHATLHRPQLKSHTYT